MSTFLLYLFYFILVLLLAQCPLSSLISIAKNGFNQWFKYLQKMSSVKAVNKRPRKWKPF
jgi:hypothetical protein